MDWSLDDNGPSDCLTALPLEAGGVHEIKPARDETAGGAALIPAIGAARTFALAAIARRLEQIDRTVEALRGAPVLWCTPRHRINETGALYGPGLAAFGLPPERFLIVTPRDHREGLWTMEEGLRSGALALVVGLIENIGLTSARRLALAARALAVPCLLLTGAGTPPAAATASRWRVGPAPSTSHPLFATMASGFGLPPPGPPRLCLSLERYRLAPARATANSSCVEWCDETLRLHLAADLPDRPLAHVPASQATPGSEQLYAAG